jgi:hypothetical protein
MPAQLADIPPGDGEVLGRNLSALYWGLAVPSDYLGVKVENGWATISGHVAQSYQKSCAEADGPRGLRRQGVTNGIDAEATVGPAASVPPHVADSSDRAGGAATRMKEGTMLRSEVIGQSPRAPPWRDLEWKESEDSELVPDTRELTRAFDEMLQHAFDEMLQREADGRRVSGVRA